MTDIIIVEDDPNAAAILEIFLENTKTDNRILAICETVADAIKKIDKLKPNLVFLDINLPDGLGFDILSKTKFNEYKVVFTTVNTDFAIRAFEMSALHYIVKPYSEKQIDEALQRFGLQNIKDTNSEIIEFVTQAINNKIDRLVLPANNVLTVFNLKDIIRIEAEANYTNFYLYPSLKLIVGKNIRYYEELLQNCDFIRIHHKHIINMIHIKKIVKAKSNTIIMTDNSELPVSSRRKDDIELKLKEKLYY